MLIQGNNEIPKKLIKSQIINVLHAGRWQRYMAIKMKEKVKPMFNAS